MSRGYNLPESTGPNDPDAPWNQEKEFEEVYTCTVCGREFDTPDELYHSRHCCGFEANEECESCAGSTKKE